MPTSARTELVSRARLSNFQYEVGDKPDETVVRCLVCGWESSSVSDIREMVARKAGRSRSEKRQEVDSDSIELAIGSPMPNYARNIRVLLRHREKDCSR